MSSSPTAAGWSTASAACTGAERSARCRCSPASPRRERFAPPATSTSSSSTHPSSSGSPSSSRSSTGTSARSSPSGLHARIGSPPARAPAGSSCSATRVSRCSRTAIAASIAWHTRASAVLVVVAGDAEVETLASLLGDDPGAGDRPAQRRPRPHVQRGRARRDRAPAERLVRVDPRARSRRRGGCSLEATVLDLSAQPAVAFSDAGPRRAARRPAAELHRRRRLDRPRRPLAVRAQRRRRARLRQRARVCALGGPARLRQARAARRLHRRHERRRLGRGSVCDRQDERGRGRRARPHRASPRPVRHPQERVALESLDPPLPAQRGGGDAHRGRADPARARRRGHSHAAGGGLPDVACSGRR